MESNVERRVLAATAPKMTQPEADVPMEVEAFESGITRLEQQFNQVQTSQIGMEQKMCQLDHAVHQVQASQAGVEHGVSQMQLQLDQQSQHITHALDRKVSEQMEKIEALLCKRGRRECLSSDATANNELVAPCSVHAADR